MGSSSSPDPLSEDLASLRIQAPATKEPSSSRPLRLPVLVGLALLAVATPWAVWHVLHQPLEVQLAVVHEEVAPSAPVSLSAAGYLVAERVARLGPRVTGRIQRVLVRESERVRDGQVLVALDAADAQGAVATAQAEVELARARVQAARAQLSDVEQRHARATRLVAAQVLPSAEAQDLAARLRTERELVRAAAAEVRVKEEEARLARTRLDNLTLRAPMDGLVSTRPVAVGDVVTPSSILFELVDEGSLRVEVDVPEAHLGRLTPGTPCEVVFDAFPQQRLAGVVVDIAPRINRAKATGTVKVRLEKTVEGLRPEMAARVNFLSRAPKAPATEAGAPPARWVPATAVAQREGKQVLFVFASGVVQQVPVELGRTNGAEVELKTGPGAGARVVLQPPPGLAHDQHVQEKQP